RVGTIISMQFSQNSRWILTVGRGGITKLWDARTGQMIRDFGQSSNSGTWLNADARRLLALSSDADVLSVWDTQLGSETALLDLPVGNDPPLEFDHEFPAAFSPDGKRLLATGSDGIGRVWETATGTMRVRLSKGIGSQQTGMVAALSS